MSVYYDPMLAKVIATGETREAAISRLTAALRDYPILGIRANAAFLSRILEHPRLRSGDIDTDFLDGEGAALVEAGEVEPPPWMRAAVAAHERLRSPAAGGRATEAWDPWQRLRQWRG